MPLISLVSEGDWEAVNQNFARINAKLDETAVVTHDSIILTGLTAGCVCYTDTTGVITTDTGFTFSSGLLTVTNDGSPQLRLNSDGVGYVTFEGVGASLNISHAGIPGGVLTTNGAIQITDHTIPQLYLTYSAGNACTFDVDGSGNLTINPTGTTISLSSSILQGISLLYVDNLSLNGNTLSSLSGDLGLGSASGAIGLGSNSLTTTGTISGINVTSGVDPGHTHSASSITEADTLATVVARGDDAEAEINVGVGNTLTLASGSITDSTGAISFGDENLTTLGNLGVGTSTLAGVGVYIIKTITSGTSIGISGAAYQTGVAGTSGIRGLDFNATWQPASITAPAGTCSELGGAKATINVVAPVSENSNLTVTSAYGFWSIANYNRQTADPTKNLTITNHRAFWAANPTLSGTTLPIITTLAAFYDAGMTAGTTNWGLAINTNSYINAKLRIGDAVVPTEVLDVTGNGLISGTLGVTGELSVTTAISCGDSDF